MIIQRDLEIECLKKHPYPDSRYFFDMDFCTVSKGWAQIDTYQDAPYFGAWTNPTTYEFMTYVEGDVIYKKADSKEEYIKEVDSVIFFFGDEGDEKCNIDPGCGKLLNTDKKKGEASIYERTGPQQKFVELGLNKYFYEGQIND